MLDLYLNGCQTNIELFGKRKKIMNITAHFVKSRKDKPADAMAISVSKAKTFESCAAKYRFCYIEKLPRKDWDFHIFGKFNHEVLETFHNKLLENKDLEFIPLMKECFKLSVENWKGKMTPVQLKDSQIIQQNYLNYLDSNLKNNTLPEVIGVEKEFNIVINEKILLNGFIDRVQVDHDGMLHVADYKTTKDKKYLKDFFQLITYAYVLMLEDESLEKIRASFILLKHNFEFITKEFSRDKVMKISEKFLEYEKQISEEKLWRAKPQFLCKYCDYQESCKEGTDFLIKRGLLKGGLKIVGKSTW